MELEQLRRLLLGKFCSDYHFSSVSATVRVTYLCRFSQAGICFLCIVYTYFRIPEPRGRTFAELDVLFERGISARKFSTTEVDVFHETVEDKIMVQYEDMVHHGPGKTGMLA